MSAVTYATAQILRVLPRARIGRAIGRLADHRWSPPVGRAVVGLYSRVYDVRARRVRRERRVGELRRLLHAPSARRRARRSTPTRAPSQPRRRAHRVDGHHRRGRHLRGQGPPLRRGGARRRRAGGPRAFSAARAASSTFRRATTTACTRPCRAPSAASARCRATIIPVNSIGMRHVANLFARNRRVSIEIDAGRRARARDGGDGRRDDRRAHHDVGIDAHDVPLGDHVFEPPLRVAPGPGDRHLPPGLDGGRARREAARSGRWLVGEGPVRFGQALMRGDGMSEDRRAAPADRSKRRPRCPSSRPHRPRPRSRRRRRRLTDGELSSPPAQSRSRQRDSSPSARRRGRHDPAHPRRRGRAPEAAERRAPRVGASPCRRACPRCHPPSPPSPATQAGRS